MTNSFGSFKKENLQTVVSSKEFQRLWNVKKDDVKVCQDCEYRYVCTDCRAFIENPEDLHSKPLKCGYNPYTNEWEEWSKHPQKQNAIQFYQLS